MAHNHSNSPSVHVFVHAHTLEMAPQGTDKQATDPCMPVTCTLKSSRSARTEPCTASMRSASLPRRTCRPEFSVAERWGAMVTGTEANLETTANAQVSGCTGADQATQIQIKQWQVQRLNRHTTSGSHHGWPHAPFGVRSNQQGWC